VNIGLQNTRLFVWALELDEQRLAAGDKKHPIRPAIVAMQVQLDADNPQFLEGPLSGLVLDGGLKLSFSHF
jgi:hypothetical protein